MDSLNDNKSLGVESLPLEILCEILVKLSLNTVLMLRCISRNLRDVIDKYYLNHLFATERLINLNLKDFASTSTNVDKLDLKLQQLYSINELWTDARIVLKFKGGYDAKTNEEDFWKLIGSFLLSKSSIYGETVDLVIKK